jgi:hypothetical protein
MPIDDVLLIDDEVLIDDELNVEIVADQQAADRRDNDQHSC